MFVTVTLITYVCWHHTRCLAQAKRYMHVWQKRYAQDGHMHVTEHHARAQPLRDTNTPGPTLTQNTSILRRTPWRLSAWLKYLVHANTCMYTRLPKGQHTNMLWRAPWIQWGVCLSVFLSVCPCVCIAGTSYACMHSDFEIPWNCDPRSSETATLQCTYHMYIHDMMHAHTCGSFAIPLNTAESFQGRPLAHSRLLSLRRSCLHVMHVCWCMPAKVYVHTCAGFSWVSIARIP
jgi:hypothetical protein